MQAQGKHLFRIFVAVPRLRVCMCGHPSISGSVYLCDEKGLNYVAAVGTRLEFSAGSDVRGNLAPITCNCL